MQGFKLLINKLMSQSNASDDNNSANSPSVFKLLNPSFALSVIINSPQKVETYFITPFPPKLQTLLTARTSTDSSQSANQPVSQSVHSIG